MKNRESYSECRGGPFLGLKRNSNFLFIILSILLLILPQLQFAQDSGDVLEYNSQKVLLQPKEAIRLSEGYLRLSNLGEEQKCKAKLVLAKAYTVQEEYDKAIQVLFELQDEDCVLTKREVFQLLLQKDHISREMKLDEYEQEIFEEINLFIKEEENSQLKEEWETRWWIQNSMYNLHHAGSRSEDFFRELELPKDTSFFVDDKILYGQYQLIKAWKNTQSLDEFDLKKALSNQFDIRSSDLDLLYYRYFALDEAMLLKAREEDEKAYLLLDTTRKRIEDIDGYDYYKHKIFTELKQFAIAQKDKELVTAYQKGELLYSNEVDLIFTNAITKIFAHKSDKHLKSQQAQQDKFNRVRSLFVVIGGIIVIVAFVFLLRYSWQEKYYKETLTFIHTMNEKAAKKSTEKTLPKKTGRTKLKISEETEEQILKGLASFENNVEFLKGDISLAYLASELKVNTKYLSEVLNSRMNENFNTYINRLRVEYIVKKLKNNPEFLKYKISYLAEITGYSSHSSFTTAFKGITGVPPTKFIGVLKREA